MLLLMLSIEGETISLGDGDKPNIPRLICNEVNIGLVPTVPNTTAE